MRSGTALEQKHAMGQMVLATAFWSVAGIFIKLVPWNAFAIAGWRGLVAAGVVGLYMRLTHARVCFSRQNVFAACAMAFTGFCFVAANKLTTAANAIVLQFTSPVFLLLGSALFLHQRIRRGDVLAVALTMGGIAFFFFDSLDAGRLAGNCIGVLSGVGYAAMCMSLNRCGLDERLSATFLSLLLSAVIGIPFTFFTNPEVTTTAVLSLLALGVLQLGAGYILFVRAQEHCSALAICLLSVGEPLLNPLWVFLFDGEAPGLYALLGGAVVIATVTVWSVWQTREAERELKSGHTI